MFIVESFLFWLSFDLLLSLSILLIVNNMKNKPYSKHQAASFRLICPPLPWAQCTSHPLQWERSSLWQTNLVPNVGPMVCGHPMISLPSSTTISLHGVTAQHPTSKFIWKLISLTEKQQLNVWHFTGAQPPNFRQQTAQCSVSMCTTHTNCTSGWRKGLCPIYHQGTSRTVSSDPACSKGEWWQEANFPRGKPISGGLWHLKRKVASDTPVEADLQFL